MQVATVTYEPVKRLSRDLAKATATLTSAEARFLVDNYYMIQKNRIRSENQIRALTESEEPHELLVWLFANMKTLEDQIKRGLDSYSKSQPIGEWSRSILGIGPVIAAGLMAHIDITEAPTVGHIWAFAGLDPSKRWEKKKKRPWNASLKTLCWKIGESFVKVSGKEESLYGRLYVERKEYEAAKNEKGDYEEQAAIKAKVVGKSTEAYKHYSVGKLPPGHLHARAKRYAVKIFLAHWHGKQHQFHYGKPAPKPYPIAIQGHAHII